MADIEFGELGDGGDRGDVVEGETVTGMGLEAVLGGERGGVGEAAELFGAGFAFEMRVAAGVELDDRRAEADRSLDLGRVGLDEQADADVRGAELVDIISKLIVLPGRVEAAFGGPLLALFGDDAGGVGAVGQRDFEHFLGRRHFEVQRDFEPGHERVDIGVGDVPPVLAQMGGDPVGAGRGGGEGGADRIGVRPAARVPDRRDMIDIDAKAEGAVKAPSRKEFRAQSINIGEWRAFVSVRPIWGVGLKAV